MAQQIRKLYAISPFLKDLNLKGYK